MRWLGDADAPVVAVLDVDSTHIDVERLRAGRPTAEAAHIYGGALAVMHDAGVGSAGFGCPPAGFEGKIFIGSHPMSSTHTIGGVSSMPPSGYCRLSG